MVFPALGPVVVALVRAGHHLDNLIASSQSKRCRRPARGPHGGAPTPASREQFRPGVPLPLRHPAVFVARTIVVRTSGHRAIAGLSMAGADAEYRTAASRNFRLSGLQCGLVRGRREGASSEAGGCRYGNEAGRASIQACAGQREPQKGLSCCGVGFASAKRIRLGNSTNRPLLNSTLIRPGLS